MRKVETLAVSLQALEDAGIPSLYHRCGVPDLKLTDRQLGLLTRYASVDYKEKHLLITGQAQTRKTTAACVVLKSLIARHKLSALYVDLRTLVAWHFQQQSVSKLKEQERVDRYALALECDALVIDDCESHKNEGCFMALDYVFRTRAAYSRTTIIVCEEDDKCTPVLAREFGPRLAEKIINNSVHVSLDANEAD